MNGAGGVHVYGGCVFLRTRALHKSASAEVISAKDLRNGQNCALKACRRCMLQASSQ